MKTKIYILLQGVIIALLIAILALQITGSSGITGDYVSQTLSEQKQMQDYRRKIGEENIKISNDKIFNGDYGSSIIGEVKNTSDKTVDSVSVNITLYNGKTPVYNSSDYFNSIESGGTRNLDFYIPSDIVFDGYTIDYVEGVIYE